MELTEVLVTVCEVWYWAVAGISASVPDGKAKLAIVPPVELLIVLIDTGVPACAGNPLYTTVQVKAELGTTFDVPLVIVND